MLIKKCTDVKKCEPFHGRKTLNTLKDKKNLIIKMVYLLMTVLVSLYNPIMKIVKIRISLFHVQAHKKIQINIREKRDLLK